MIPIKNYPTILYEYYSQFKGKILRVNLNTYIRYLLIEDIKLNGGGDKIYKCRVGVRNLFDNKKGRLSWIRVNNCWLFNTEDMTIITEDEFNKERILQKLGEQN